MLNNKYQIPSKNPVLFLKPLYKVTPLIKNPIVEHIIAILSNTKKTTTSFKFLFYLIVKR
jgi:hypothetical protein